MFDITEGIVDGLGFPQFFDGAAAFTAASDMVSAANITALATSSLSASSAMSSSAVILVQGASALSAEVTLTITTTVVNAAASLVAGQSNMTATSSFLFDGSASMSASVDLSASEVLVRYLVPRTLTGTLTLSAALYEPLNVLVLPVVQYTYTEDRLLRRYSINSGQSLLINGTTGVIQDFVAQEDTLNADYYFAGGHRYVLDTAEVAAVTNSGHGDLITIETL